MDDNIDFDFVDTHLVDTLNFGFRQIMIH